MRRAPRRTVVLLAACSIVAGACGSEPVRDFTVGFKRVALDLAYKDEALAAEPTREDILLPQPVPAQAAFVTQVRVPARLAPLQPLPPAPPECPTAGADAHPDEPATVFVTQPPLAGTYTTHNTGSIRIEGAIPVTFAFPPRGVLTIRDVRKTAIDDPLTGPTDVITYDVFVPGLDGGGTTTTYQVTFSPAPVVGTVVQTAGAGKAPQGELTMVRLQITLPSGKVDFRPEPPITIASFRSGQGTSWTSSGIDRADGTSMVVQGSVTQRKNIDLCGVLFDTYEVVSNEHIVNLRTGLRSDTAPTDPNVYHIATHHGGVFIHQHINTTTSFPGVSGTPTIITAVYDQTFDSIDPLEARAG
jgi:hypothetical protein